ncbi:MAG: RrF2 family transcriptional regulator, partial [Planctomycetia bacterium]
PRPFAANILKALCQEGLVESRRGPNGGYLLARPPREITLADVIGAMDGPVRLMSCAPLPQGSTLSADDSASTECELAPVCPVRSPLRFVHDRLLKVLRDTTLEDLGSSPPLFVPLKTEPVTNGSFADLSR